MHGSSVYCVCMSECRACLLCKASWTTRYPPGISKHGIMNFSTLTFAICTSTNTHMHMRAHTSTHIPIQHSSHAYVHLLSFSPSHLSLFLCVFLNTLHLVGRTPASTFHTYIMHPTVRIFKKRRREGRGRNKKKEREQSDGERYWYSCLISIIDNATNHFSSPMRHDVEFEAELRVGWGEQESRESFDMQDVYRAARRDSKQNTAIVLYCRCRCRCWINDQLSQSKELHDFIFLVSVEMIKERKMQRHKWNTQGLSCMCTHLHKHRPNVQVLLEALAQRGTVFVCLTLKLHTCLY